MGGEQVGVVSPDEAQNVSKWYQLRTVPWVLAWATEELGVPPVGLGPYGGREEAG